MKNHGKAADARKKKNDRGRKNRLRSELRREATRDEDFGPDAFASAATRESSSTC